MSDPSSAGAPGTGYVYDQSWSEERRRLAGIEAMWDPGSRELLARNGAVPGAQILEVGGGGGSLVAWMEDVVGTGGRVLAVDIDTRFLEPLASPVVEVLKADVTTHELPVEAFDLVHARLVLEHLNERAGVLDRLVASLRPGGRLVIEDYDWTSFGFESADELELRASDGILAFMTAAGFDRQYGRRVVGELAARGLGGVAGEGRSLVIDDTHPGFSFFSLSFEQLAPAAVKAGTLREEDAEVMRERMEVGGRRIITPSLIAAFGERTC